MVSFNRKPEPVKSHRVYSIYVGFQSGYMKTSLDRRYILFTYMGALGAWRAEKVSTEARVSWFS